MKHVILTTLVALLLVPRVAEACTNILVTKGASVDGSTMISYAADSHTLYGELYHWPAAKYPAGALLKVYEWDTGKYLGEIAQARETYNVVGNINEHGLSIGETTYGGRPELVDTLGLIDYGSLIYITLQRAKTAREAIKVMTGLVEEYGYYSSGESMSIADENEVWIFEIIGKGSGNKGAVWVAKRIPDGYVSAHANQARITTIDFDDKENTLYAPDVVTFARSKGYFSGKDSEFSFSDVYAPLDYGAIRFCEARVWSFFNSVNPKIGQEYLPYILGEKLNRMPLWIKPDKKVSYRDVQKIMRDHFEGTPLDMTADVGAGSYGCPYRWRPLTWDVDGETFFNERAIATQQTGFSFVSQIRSNVPAPLKGILWFGLDDAATSVYFPVYGGTTSIPECVKVGNGDMLTYSSTSAFWLFNRVANNAYTRYNAMIEDILPVQKKLEDQYSEAVKKADAEGAKLFAKSPKKAVKFINTFVNEQASVMMNDWKGLEEFLLVKYIDGNTKQEEGGKFLRNPHGLPASPKHPGYSPEFYRYIKESTGDKLKMREVPEK
jgi:dipeptidase